mmetsp:Transcript_97218/g.261239  ORF Transcript_97218/g.261239 Transcript_97218/m.261239 type:complete len:96 (+) Transcript_97218:205-492(+)
MELGAACGRLYASPTSPQSDANYFQVEKNPLHPEGCYFDVSPPGGCGLFFNSASGQKAISASHGPEEVSIQRESYLLCARGEVGGDKQEPWFTMV